MRLNSYLILGLIALVLLLANYFTKRAKKFTQQKTSSSVLFVEILKLGVGIAVFAIVSLGLIHRDGFTLSVVETEGTDETVQLVTDSTDTGNSKYYLSQQTWRDFNKQKHSLPFKVQYEAVLNAHKNRNAFAITPSFSWGIFYKYVVDHDTPLVEELSLAFYNYQKEKNMSRRDFAELIISAIQDIPYSLLLSDECKKSDVQPCFSHIKLGVLAPAEFVSSLRADCDTRTLLIYTLLSRFNYDVAILNSEKYLHSVIGLNIPSTGKYKTLKNKKYYFVETTARGCPIGYLPNDVSNISYWTFVLIHNQQL
ncbi:MAG: hypothetical protein ABJN95_12780 [Maribacter sp.]|uniref:hypothetical protein n=1 Tax=Maribacter sp. TaxID=1897614 RepID=UPI003299D891